MQTFNVSKSVLLVALLLLFRPFPAFSQYGEWEPAAGPINIAGLGIAPNGDYFVSSSQYLYRSTDRGATWTANRAESLENNLYSVSGPILFTSAGILVGGCLTTDDGAHWIVSKYGPAFNGTVFQDPRHQTLFGIGAKYEAHIGPDWNEPQIVSSEDGGLTWNVLLSTDQLDSIQTLLGVTSNHVLFGQRANGQIFRFDGSAWARVDSENRVQAIDEVTPENLVMFAQASIVRSYDNGLTWAVRDSARITYEPILQIDSTSFLAGENGELVFTHDTGHSFRTLPGNFGGVTSAIGEQNINLILFANASSVWLNESPSTNPILSSAVSQYGGINDFAISKWGTLYAINGSVPVQSSDKGLSWYECPETYASQPVTGTTITIDSDDYRYLSNSNGGATIRINPDAEAEPLPINGVQQLVAHPDGSLLARTDSGSFRSTDKGNTWTPLPHALPIILGIDHAGIIYGYDLSLYLPHQLYRSTDVGQSWTPILTQFTDRMYSFDPQFGPLFGVDNQNRVFIAIDSLGLLRSTNHGDTWDTLPMPLGLLQINPYEQITGFGIDGNNIFYVDIFGYVIHSRDEGVTWDEGFDEFNFRYIAQSPDGNLFAWYPTGYTNSPATPIVRYVGEPLTAGISEPAPPSRSQIVFPNPFTGTTNFQLDIDSPGPVSISVFDQLGREVWNENRTVSTGLQRIEFDGQAMPAATYFYRVRIGNEVTTGTLVLEH